MTSLRRSVRIRQCWFHINTHHVSRVDTSECYIAIRVAMTTLAFRQGVSVLDGIHS